MYPYRQLRYSYSPYRNATLATEPDIDLLTKQLDEEMMNMRTDLERRIYQLHQMPHALPLLDADMGRSPAWNRYPVASVTNSPFSLAKPRRENFELSFDVSQFSPEELTVKTEGRRLIVTGKRDKKVEMENGNYTHEFWDFKREAEIPDDVNPEDIQCLLSSDGKLCIHTSCLVLPAAQGRLVPIQVGWAQGGRQ